MKILLVLTVLAAAQPAWAAPADDVAALAWMAGSWSQESGGVTIPETWLAPNGGAMSGVGQTNRPGRPAYIEFMKITAEPTGATFTAIQPGSAPVGFVLVAGKPGEAVFENKAHDFPQRVIYRRCGEDLCGRIEGR